jgi:hypothetical protein
MIWLGVQQVLELRSSKYHSKYQPNLFGWVFGPPKLQMPVQIPAKSFSECLLELIWRAICVSVKGHS